MARIICKTCGTEAAVWTGQCPNCSGTTHIELTKPVDPMIGKTVHGGLKILRKLGQGGMGAVYLAEREGLGQKVALKFLNANLLTNSDVARRFINEAKTYARISHPNAVTLHDFQQDEDGALYIAMEYIEGTDLTRYIAERKRVPPAEAIEIALQVADVLHSAHAMGIIHRDLKPENVMIRTGMRGIFVKVLDFGIARLLDDGSTRLTQAGSIAGTPRYMAPEQVRAKDVDARADIYALGILLFEMLTGEHPFEGSSVAEILSAQVMTPMKHLGEVAPEFDGLAVDAVIQKATAKLREERYETMQHFAQALSNVVPTMTGFVPAQVPEAEADALAGGDTFIPNAVSASDKTLPAEPARDGFSKTAYPSPPVVAPRPRTGLWVGGAVGLLALVGVGVALALGGGRSPAPNGATEGASALAQPGAPGAAPRAEVQPAEVVPAAARVGGDAAAPVDDGRARFLSEEILLKARAAFAAGNLDEARRISEVLSEPHPAVEGDLAKLVGDLQDAQRQLKQGQALVRQGDCARAIAVFDALLKSYPSVKDARRARASCQRMLPPSIAQ